PPSDLAVAPSRHDPDAIARVVAEEQRAVVGPGVGAAGVEADGGDDRAVVQRAAVATDHRDAVLVVVVGADRAARGVEVLADVEVGPVVAGLASGALVARPAEVHRGGGRRGGSGVDLLPGVPADVADPQLGGAGAEGES